MAALARRVGIGVPGVVLFLGLWAPVMGVSQTVLPLPNSSFESPDTPFADPIVDSWEKTPKPPWFVEEPPQNLWINLTGVFENTSPGEPDHIGNMDGDQGLFLFAVPQVGLFQDYTSIGGTNTEPDQLFDKTYEPGRSYTLTVGVIGGGGGMTEGAALGLGLYYRDASSNRVSVAMTNIAFSSLAFPNTTNFIDFSVRTPVVSEADAWAGKFIGVELLSTIDFSYTNGGYWDLDDVRLTESVAPRLTDPAWDGGAFRFTLQSDAGLAFEILASTNVLSPVGAWTVLETVTNATGSTNLVDGLPGAVQRYYRARSLP